MKNGSSSECCILDIERKKLLNINVGEKNLLPHMWSSDNKHYLFGSISRDIATSGDISIGCTWYIYSLDSNKTDVVYKGGSKHCYFDETGRFLILLDDDLVIKVLFSDSLETVTERSIKEFLNENEKIDFSIYDPFENQVIFEINPSLENIVGNKKWVAIKYERKI